MSVTLSVILPVQNQEKIILPVFKEIHKILDEMDISYEIILAENGSTDNTITILNKIGEKYAHTKILTSENGYGNAILKGIKNSKGKYLLYMPSDGQVDLKIIPQLLKLSRGGGIHIAKIKRRSRENFTRYAISKLLAFSLFIFFKTPLIDVNGSPRIIKKSDFELLKIKSKDSFIDAEMLIKAMRRNWTIQEIPMKHIKRRGGQSSRTISTYIEFIRNIIFYKFRNSHMLSSKK